jgi:hypothetical protein
MADKTQFGGQQRGSTEGLTCANCERLLMDALDGTLTAEEQAAFDLHLIHCSACASRMADARRGAAWMEMLKDAPPEPPDTLVNRILAQTSAMNVNALVAGTQSEALPAPGKVLAFRPRFALNAQTFTRVVMHPRLAMTAAMAFFSVALTLNLVGVQVTKVRLADLKPSSLRRSFYQTNAHVMRYYDNLRVVYELESRVRDLQRDNDRENEHRRTETAAPAPETKKPAGGGSSRRIPPAKFRTVAMKADRNRIFDGNAGTAARKIVRTTGVSA